MLAWPPRAPNLILDGNFEEVPSPDKLTGLENHANAYCWHQPTVPGWQLAGKTPFVFIKNPSRRGLDVSNGSASQVLATVPGNSYTLTFRAFMNTEFRKNCTVLVDCGGQTSRHQISPEGSFSVDFVAKGSSTKVTFSGAGEAGGPRIYQVKCVGFDAAARKLINQLESVYRDLDRGEKSERDLSALTALLAPDFSWQPLEGAARDRSGYEDLVRSRFDKKFKVSSELLNASTQSDGSIQMEVERRESQLAAYGKVDVANTRFLHTWIKSDKGWLLKSAQQVAP